MCTQAHIHPQHAQKPLGIPRLLDPTYARALDVLLGKVDPFAFACGRERPRLMNKHLVSRRRRDGGAMRRSCNCIVDMSNPPSQPGSATTAAWSVYCVWDGRRRRDGRRADRVEIRSARSEERCTL